MIMSLLNTSDLRAGSSMNLFKEQQKRLLDSTRPDHQSRNSIWVFVCCTQDGHFITELPHKKFPP